jgi:F0F1-type ATP synthase assembly protein I
MFDKEEYKKVINIPLAVIIASFIIIIITTGMTNKNGVSSLIGGYTGLLLGILFVIILNIQQMYLI